MTTHPILASTATTVLDYIDVLIWPFVVVFAIVLFRDEIAELIRKLRKASALGVEVGFDQQQSTAEAAEDIEDYAEGLADRRELVAVDAGEGGDAGAAAVAAESDLDDLRGEVETKTILLDFERTWNVIYGSQLAVLRALSAAPAGLPRSAIEPVFEDAKKNRGLLPSWKFDDWMGFLLRTHHEIGLPLVEINERGNYQLSARGSAFLGYVDRIGYSWRPF